MGTDTYILEVGKDEVLLGNGTSETMNISIDKLDAGLARPFVKWAGGKRWLAQISNHLRPKDWNGTYLEPFLGGGSFFFSIAPKDAIISDINKELITAYRVIKRSPHKLIKILKEYPNDRDFYYALRSHRPTENVEIAARFLYLNRVCWNGLYRVNPKGEFNTPFGTYKNPGICDQEKILKASKALRNVRIKRSYFLNIIRSAGRNDWLYIDPPYITGHQNNGFLEYNQNLFSWKDQIKLANAAKESASAGANVLVSNADYPQVVDLYKGFYYYRAKRQSLIGRLNSSRGVVTEAILSSYPLLDAPSVMIA